MTKMIKDNIQFIGLDFETSTGDHRTLAPIQIGLTTNGVDYQSTIGGWKFDDSESYRWSEESYDVHKIKQEALEYAPNIFEVDIYASSFMLQNKLTQRMNRVCVGWNVGSFDRQIVYRWMPNLDKILSYRTLDLNTVCYFVADLVDGSYEALKKEVKARAAIELGGENWHDALFDAKAGLLTYRYLQAIAGKSLMEYAKDRAL